ncbi:hypothetical protein OV079_02555 [Nannocystis pusilla]|uniref:Uncharacterized protein n=1 Tax=Nannocystis pusilla TaxID=889268 RepID=A0A9X3ITW5_9BACT|nr:hypothetical protein [Nannocystis pusilla]MCY1004467.1 hypothetical protein [Nannocystis pusilla]
MNHPPASSGVTRTAGDDEPAEALPGLDIDLPPPAAFEMDDQWQQWKAYGAPQVHNFPLTGLA